jgi:hypothetical protein
MSQAHDDERKRRELIEQTLKREQERKERAREEQAKREKRILKEEGF